MNFQLERPEAVVSARESKRGMNWFLEILVFIVVFFLCMFAQSICAVPIDMLRASAEADYKKAVALGDMEKIAEATYRIGNMDLYTALSLISTEEKTCNSWFYTQRGRQRVPDRSGSRVCHVFGGSFALRADRRIEN